MLSEKQARPDSPPSNPFDEPQGKKSSDSQGSAGGISAAAAAAAGQKKHSPKSSWEGSEPPTPKSTKFGTAAAVPVAAAGAARDVPPPRGPNNVHRVQLDFKPSMDDELELRSGQLVRMLHEYDDGWVSCSLRSNAMHLLTICRRSASEWTAASRVSPPVLACQSSR